MDEEMQQRLMTVCGETIEHCKKLTADIAKATEIMNTQRRMLDEKNITIERLIAFIKANQLEIPALPEIQSPGEGWKN